jgi:hypothetical protein
LRGNVGQVVFVVDVTSAEQLSPVVHTQDTTNGTGIITVNVSKVC